MRIFLEGALALGMVLIHQLVIFLLRPASHIGLVGVDLLLLKILRARVLLDPFFFVVGDSQQDRLLLQRIQVDVIDV